LTKERMVNVPLSRLSVTNRIPMLPRFRKKGVEPIKDETVKDRKPTKADVRPMHHQFNHYSDSEDEDELPQREGTGASESEADESSRPSRETTTVSTPEPSKNKAVKALIKAKDITPKEDESEEELLKDILVAVKDAPASKRKRIIDFTSSEDEAEPSPPKKICLEDIPQVTDAMQIDEPVTPKISKAA